MGIDARLARLAPVLSAQERAILILEAWKDGRPEDPSWRHTLPPEQTRAFNLYIELMNKANLVHGRLISIQHLNIEKLQLRFNWLLSLLLWEEHTQDIRQALRLFFDEPITQSEYDARLARNRDEWAPVQELAEFLAGQREWSDDDYEDNDSWQAVRDDLWDAAVAEEEKKLRALVTKGVLRARGRGKAMKLQESAIEHFGFKVGVAPDYLLSHRVVPDSEARTVELEREGLRRITKVVDWRRDDEDDDDEFVRMPDKLREGLKESTAFNLIVLWVELRCIDVLVAEIGEEFNGIDPFAPSSGRSSSLIGKTCWRLRSGCR